MARWIREVMNPELFAVGEAACTDAVLDALLDYGITAAPVLSEDRRPLGMASIRDLIDPSRGTTLREVVCTTPSTSVERAAKLMAEEGIHHLVVVDDDGRACGMVSSLDLLRALVGLPSAHPETFPHHDDALDVRWTDPQTLDLDHVDRAPDAPGVLVLSVGGANRVEADLWAEASASLRGRVDELLEIPQDDAPALARILTMGNLRFRCTVVSDGARRAAIAQTLQCRIDAPRLPMGAR